MVGDPELVIRSALGSRPAGCNWSAAISHFAQLVAWGAFCSRPAGRNRSAAISDFAQLVAWGALGSRPAGRNRSAAISQFHECLGPASFEDFVPSGADNGKHTKNQNYLQHTVFHRSISWVARDPTLEITLDQWFGCWSVVLSDGSNPGKGVVPSPTIITAPVAVLGAGLLSAEIAPASIRLAKAATIVFFMALTSPSTKSRPSTRVAVEVGTPIAASAKRELTFQVIGQRQGRPCQTTAAGRIAVSQRTSRHPTSKTPSQHYARQRRHETELILFAL